MRKAVFIIPLFVFMLFFSCLRKNNDNIEWNKIAEKSVEKFTGKTMNFTDTFTCISYNTKDSSFIFSYKPTLKVIVYVDGTCGACLINLKSWQSIITKVYQKRKDCFFYILVNWPHEIAEASNPLLKTGFLYSWYLDRECSFFRSYEIYDKRLQAVLLNEKNELLLIGDPSLNPELGDLYLETILNYKNENESLLSGLIFP